MQQMAKIKRHVDHDGKQQATTATSHKRNQNASEYQKDESTNYRSHHNLDRNPLTIRMFILAQCQAFSDMFCDIYCKEFF
jgi:hypothetical protein